LPKKNQATPPATFAGRHHHAVGPAISGIRLPENLTSFHRCQVAADDKNGGVIEETGHQGCHNP
jgi:hypothetical protein